MVLTFSPPDQEANRRREAEDLARRQANFERRVQRARANGQLLEFSPTSGRPLQSFGDEQDRKINDSQNCTSSKDDELVRLVGGQQAAIQNLEGQMSQFLIMQTKSFEEGNKAEQLTGLQAKNLQLEEANAMLEKALARTEQEKKNLQDQIGEMKDRLLIGTTKLESEIAAHKNEAQSNLMAKELLSSKLEEVKEQYLIERTRMESEIDSLKRESEIRLEGLGESRKGLEEEKQKLLARVEELEIKLLQSKDQHTDMKATQSKLSSDREHLIEAKSRLEVELEKISEEKFALQKQLSVVKQELTQIQTKVLPEAESKCKALSIELAMQKKATEVVEMQVADCKKTIDQMKQELADLERGKEEERINFQKLNMDSAKAFAKLERESAQKDKQIDALNKEIETIAADLEVEQQNREAIMQELKQHDIDANKAIEELEARANYLASELETEMTSRKKTEKRLQVKESEMIQAIKNMQADAECAANELDKERRLRQGAQDELKQKEAASIKFAADAQRLGTELEHEKQLRGELMAEFKQSASEARHGMEELTAQLETFEYKLTLADTETAILRDKLEDANRHIKQLTNAKQEALTMNSDVTNSLRSNEKTIEELMQKIDSLRQNLCENQMQLKQTQTKLKATAAERDDANNRLVSFDDREEELFRKLHESDRIRRDLHAKVMQLSGNIRVFVRVRPELPGEKEKTSQLDDDVDPSNNARKRKHAVIDEVPFKFPGLFDGDGNVEGDDLCKNLVELTEPPKDRGGLKERKKKWRFGFDHVFPPSKGQDEIWQATEPLVQSAIDGYNVCIFAYGQTGSGKTYTMLGDQSNQGIISRAVQKLFEAKQEIEMLSKGRTSVSIAVELLEIYNEKIRDLLSTNSTKDQNLKITSHDVEGNVLATTTSSDEVMQILEIAQSRRCVKATNSNAESSRSHMVFTIHFNVSVEDGVKRKGKLHVCDLAGSERLNKSGANASGGSLLQETKSINSSLSVLSNVIEKLQQGNPNVPFRESKLTMLLQNSLGGNSKTLAIVCCNPLASHFHESLCSLRFADKVNKVELKASSNFSC